jgi:hypothetical protein
MSVRNSQFTHRALRFPLLHELRERHPTENDEAILGVGRFSGNFANFDA